MLIGTVYLLHFDRPYWGPRQHYVGSPATCPGACGRTGRGTVASPLAGRLTRGSGSPSPGSGGPARCGWSARSRPVARWTAARYAPGARGPL